MVSLDLNPDLDARLTAVAAETGKPKAFHIEAALAEYLEDRALAEEAMHDYDPSENINHEEMKRRLGLDNRVRRPRAKSAGKLDS